MYARHASRFSMRACSGSVLAPEAGWFALAGADRVSTCITSGAELAHDHSPQRLATNKLTTVLPDTFKFDPSLAHPIRDGWVRPKSAAQLSAPSELSALRTQSDSSKTLVLICRLASWKDSSPRKGTGIQP